MIRNAQWLLVKKLVLQENSDNEITKINMFKMKYLSERNHKERTIKNSGAEELNELSKRHNVKHLQ